MIAFEEAVATVRSEAKPLESERVPIADAHRCVLAQDVRAMVTAPPRDVSAMDGYAVREKDLGGIPVRLRVIGKSFPGDGHVGRIGVGECMRIFTGAPVPANADRVIIQEMVRREGDTAVIEASPGAARHIRARGSDFAAGALLLPAGRLLDYRALVAAAGADADSVPVWRRPRVTLLSTGDELAEPGTVQEASGRIPESISFGALALARDWGAAQGIRMRLADELSAMERAAAEAIENADLVVVTGGASVGEKDFARRMFAPVGLELLFSRVAIKPGKPVWLGRAAGTLVLGLPGNPTSALVAARLFLAPLVAGLTGRDPMEALAWRTVPLATPMAACGERDTFVRARWNGSAAEPMSNQDSSAQKVLAHATLLLRRSARAPAVQGGEMVEALDL